MTPLTAVSPPPWSGLSSLLVVPPGLFRLILAFAVVISHVSAISTGRLGVLLFFYLSGYWTANIWREKYKEQKLFRFYLSRYWRIAPLFLLATFVSAWIRGEDLQFVNFTLLGIGSTNSDPTGVSWSLDVELQFYLLLPFVSALLATATIPTLIACAALAVFGWWLDNAFEVTTVLKYLPAFALGALTFIKSWRPTQRSAIISLVAFVLFTLFTATTPFISKRAPQPFDMDIWAMLWMVPLLPYVAHSLTIRSTKLDRHLGNLSYPLYLVHFPIIAVLTGIYGTSLPVKACAIALGCVLALLVYWLFDRPVDKLRVKVVEGALPR